MSKKKNWYEEIKKAGINKEKILNTSIQQLINDKELFETATELLNKHGNQVKHFQDSIETLSVKFNFPTKNDIAAIAKILVQIEEKIDEIEDLVFVNKNKKARLRKKKLNDKKKKLRKLFLSAFPLDDIKDTLDSKKKNENE